MKYIPLIFVFLFLPLFAFGAGIVPCGGPAPEPACNFTTLIALAENLISFLIKIGAFVAAIAAVYVGWIFVTSGGDTGARTRAKEVFKNVVFGFILMLSAWLIVSLILQVLGFQGSAFLKS